MSVPVFIQIMTNGDVYTSNREFDDPASFGTVLATFRVNSDAKFQKIGNIGGVTASTSVTTPAGVAVVAHKHGKETV